jgi:hypothetical protein
MHAKGYCGMHAQRLRRTGDPLGIKRPMGAEECFWPKVDKTDTCWLWTGHVSKWGYGETGMRIRPTASGTKLAHRISYELLVGPIPEGLHLDHLCRVRHCVNPEHLEPVTAKENTERGLHGVLRTHCLRGHELTPDNVRNIKADGARRCRTCCREDTRRKRAEARAEAVLAAREGA